MPRANAQSTMGAVSPSRKLAATAALFALALVCVGLATITRRVWPLFLAWAPLLSVVWVLTRTEPPRDPGRLTDPQG
jgi:hypothetical protein